MRQPHVDPIDFARLAQGFRPRRRESKAIHLDATSPAVRLSPSATPEELSACSRQGATNLRAGPFPDSIAPTPLLGIDIHEAFFPLEFSRSRSWSLAAVARPG